MTKAKDMRPVNEARDRLLAAALNLGFGRHDSQERLADLCRQAARYVAACLKAGVAP